MAVAFRASAVGGANPTTTTTITIPAGTLTDDILFVFVTNRGATAAPTVVDDEGAGSYAMIKNQAAATNGAGSVWWKRATANTASKTITVNGCTDSMTAICYVVSGAVTSGNPYGDVLGLALASGTETSGTSCLGPSIPGGNLGLFAVFNTGVANAVTGQDCNRDAALANAAEHLSTGGNDCGANVCSATPNAGGVLRGWGVFVWVQTNGTTAHIALDVIASATDLTDGLPLVAVNAPAKPTGTTSFVIRIPTTITTNDYLVLCATNRGATADPTVVDDEGAGSWAKVANQNADTNGAGTIWWKRASANTADKLITASGLTTSASGSLQVFRSVRTTDPAYGSIVSEANASADETQAQITPLVNGSRVCLAVFQTSNDTLAVTTMACTDPGALEKQHRDFSSGGTDCAVDFASRMQATAAATGAFTWAQTNGTGASIAFALLPTVVALTLVGKGLSDSVLLHRRRLVA